MPGLITSSSSQIKRAPGLGLFLLACMSLWGSAPAYATYPDRVVKVIIPFPAGGPVDQLARPLMQKLSEALKQPFVIENRGGANGLIGGTVVAQAKPDGYTMLVTTGSLTTNTSLVAKMPFDPLKDLAPVTQVARTAGTVLVVQPDFPARNATEFVAMAKKQPGHFTYGNSGIGNPTHIAIELFGRSAGIDILSIPYKGTPETVSGILGGHIDLAAASTIALSSFINEGKLRALGIAGDVRAPNLPQVPTFAEQGYPDVKVHAFYGIFFPAGTPRDIIDMIYKTTKEMLGTQEIQNVFDSAGVVTIGSGPDEFAKFLVEDTAYQAMIIDRIGLKKQ